MANDSTSPMVMPAIPAKKKPMPRNMAVSKPSSKTILNPEYISIT